MTRDEAKRVQRGDQVAYRGEIYAVIGISRQGSAAPWFQLHNTRSNVLAKHQLCERARGESEAAR